MGVQHAGLSVAELSARRTSARAACCRPPSASTTSTASRSRSRTTGTSRPTATPRFYPDADEQAGRQPGHRVPLPGRQATAAMARADFMPTDTLRNRYRWGIWTHHEQTFDAKPFGLDSLAGTLNINRVSDDDYWRDFTRTPSLTQRLLSSDASLNWSKGDWSGTARALSYQTLQYALRRSFRPTTGCRRSRPTTTSTTGTASTSRSTPTTRVPRRPGRCSGQPNGERVFAWQRSSRPFLTPGTFVIPKVQLHAHVLPVRGAAGQRRHLGQPRGADLQPRQRPDLRARRQLLRSN